MNRLSTMWARTHDRWTNRTEPDSYTALTESFWRATLSCAAILTIGIAVYGIITFFSVLAPDIEAPVVTAGRTGGTLDRRELQTTLEGFAKRKARYDSQKASAPEIPDPSK